MFNGIEKFLERFANIRPPNEFIKGVIQRSVQEATGIAVLPDQIDLKGDSAFLTVYPPAAKNEIMIKRGDILRSIERSSGARRIRDIR